jgi:hypothetical protein
LRQNLIGRHLRAHPFPTRQTEVVIGIAILNGMLACARPKSVGCKPTMPTTK